MAYDEKATARKQIIARKARIADIDRILVQPAQMGPYGKPLVMSSQSRVRLTRERAGLLYENETEGRALAGLAEPKIANAPAVNDKTKAKPGPANSERGKAIREILGKNPTLTARQVCDRIDERYGANPLANPKIVPFRSKGAIFPRWSEAYQQNKKCRAAIDQLVARNRHK